MRAPDLGLAISDNHIRNYDGKPPRGRDVNSARTPPRGGRPTSKIKGVMRFLPTLFLAALAVPAFANQVVGTWAVSATDPEGQVHKSEMTIEQDGTALKGVVKAGQQTITMQNVQLVGEELSFKLPWDYMVLTLKMRLSGDEMKGTFATPEGDGGPVTARRIGAAPAASAGGVAGRWKVTATTGGGREMKIDIDLKQDGGKWTGSLITPDGMTLGLTEIAATAQDVSFKIPTEQGSFVIKLALEGAGMKGTYTSPDGATGPLTATR